MTDLIARLEGLSAPDRGIDLDLWWECKANRGSSNAPMPEDYRKSNLRMNDAPRYTASLDAAMTLVPEGCDVSVNNSGGRAKMCWADVHPILRSPKIRAIAATPAIALCIAALRARHIEAQGGSDA